MTRKSFNALLRLHPEHGQSIGADGLPVTFAKHRKLEPLDLRRRRLSHAGKMAAKRQERDATHDQTRNRGAEFEMRRQFFVDYWRDIRRKNGVGSRIKRGRTRLNNLLPVSYQELAA